MNNITYSNSLEALNRTYELGLRFIELDFWITKDSDIVLLHDPEVLRNDFEPSAIDPLHFLSVDFKKIKRKDDLTQMNLEMLVDWLNKHPNTYIITDIKSNNLFLLQTISSKYKILQQRFIPQIYHFREYLTVKKLGFEKIILTLYYHPSYTNRQIINFAKATNIYAVTAWEDRGLNTEIAYNLTKNSIQTYIHTINNPKTIAKLKTESIGVYTDLLENDNPATIQR